MQIMDTVDGGLSNRHRNGIGKKKKTLLGVGGNIGGNNPM